MKLSTEKKAILAGAVALTGLLVLRHKKGARGGGLDRDLSPSVRIGVEAALARETDSRVLDALAGKLEAAGFEESARTVSGRAMQLASSVGRDYFAGAATPGGHPWYYVGHDTTVVRKAQEKLASLGYDVESDGIVGPRTRKAVMEFQSLHDLDITGILGSDTIAALDQAVKGN